MQSSDASAADIVARIGTRGSPLALAQAHEVQRRLAEAHGIAPEQVAICVIRTSGDQIQDRPLYEVGGKALFTKEIEQALLAGEIDLAVHSAKDVPTFLPDGLTLSSWLPREDPRDVFICPTATILSAAIAVNVLTNVRFPGYSDRFPFLGAAVWVAILATAAWRRPDWSVLPAALRGTAFLLSLVLAASMMPVEQLPAASWLTALGLGFVSAVFDNIPLTKLALEQGGYDWGVLAYAVGFGGSMIWFGSSAGVAITNLFPEARSVGAWLRGGWHVALAYVAGFAAVMLVMGWHPHAPHKGVVTEPAVATQPQE